MASLKLVLLLATICLVNARLVVNEPEPHTYGYSTPPPVELNHGEVMMKDAILFLTPSQIKIYEASHGQNQGLKSHVSEEDIQKVEAEIKRQLAQQNIFAINQNNNEKPALTFSHLPKPVVEEPVEDTPLNKPLNQELKWLPVQQEEQKFFIPAQNDNYNFKHKPAESYSYIKLFTEHDVHETPKVQLFHPLPHDQQVHPAFEKLLEVQRDPLLHKKFKLIPYDYKALELPSLDEVKDITKLTSLLEKYEPHHISSDQLTVVPKIEEDKLEQLRKEHFKIKFVPQYEDQKNNEESEKFLLKIEKENALAKAEAVLTSVDANRKAANPKRRPSASTKAPSRQPAKDWLRKYIPLESTRDSSPSHVWKH